MEVERTATAAPATAKAQPTEAKAPQPPQDEGPSVLSSVNSARAGGSAPPAPIARVISGTEASVLRQTVRRPNPTPTRMPPAVELVYGVTGGPARALSTLLWRHDGQAYDAQWSFAYRGGGKGLYEWRSQGLLTPDGLLALRARDARGDTALSTIFDYARHTTFFETGPSEGADAPLEPVGQAHLPQFAQDPLSVLVQLSALVAAAPEKYPAGGSVTLPVVNAEGVLDWSFRIEGEEEVTISRGRVVNTLHLVYRPPTESEPQLEIWLGPRLSYLPARVRLRTPQGDVEDHTLLWGYETLVLPPADTERAPADD